MNSYEVTVRVAVHVESAEDESDASEQAIHNLSMCNDVEESCVEDVRLIGEQDE